MEKKPLSHSLEPLKGYKVGVHTRDGQHLEGILYDVKDDFLTIKNNQDDLTFFNLNLVQAIVKNTRDCEPFEKMNELIEDDSLRNVMGKHIYHWVTVKLHNQLSFSGILSRVTGNHILLTVRDKQLYIQVAHILDFFPGVPNERNQVENSSNTNMEENEQRENEKKTVKNSKKSADSKESNSKSKVKSSTKDNRKGRVAIYKKDLRKTLGQIIQGNYQVETKV